MAQPNDPASAAIGAAVVGATPLIGALHALRQSGSHQGAKGNWTGDSLATARAAMKVLRARLFDDQQRKKAEAEASERKSMVGSGDRSEKIRTYNFPQNRLTDHRINLTLYKLDRVMEGALDEILTALYEHDVEKRIKTQMA